LHLNFVEEHFIFLYLAKIFILT